MLYFICFTMLTFSSQTCVHVHKHAQTAQTWPRKEHTQTPRTNTQTSYFGALVCVCVRWFQVVGLYKSHLTTVIVCRSVSVGMYVMYVWFIYVYTCTHAWWRCVWWAGVMAAQLCFVNCTHYVLVTAHDTTPAWHACTLHDYYIYILYVVIWTTIYVCVFVCMVWCVVLCV